MWLIYALLSAVTAALVAIFAKLGLKNVDSVLATTVRAVVMGLLLILASLGLGKFTGFSLTAIASNDWLLILLSAVAGALSWLFYFLALKYGLATSVAAVDRLSIVFVIFFSALLLGESLTWKTIGGAMLMALGAILIVWR